MFPFSRVIQPSALHSFSMLSGAELTLCRSYYKHKTDGKPKDEERPSDRQLSGLAAWLLATPGGRHRAPGVCFSVWLPHEDVVFENRSNAPRQQLADGTWQPVRYNGPMDYTSWLQRWMVFEVAMLSLGAASIATLRAYRDGIERLNGEWGNHWVQIALADLKCRTYQWDRLREELLEDPEARFTESDGWDRIIAMSAYDGMSMGGRMGKWWERNLWRPLLTPSAPPPPTPAPTGYLAKRARLSQVDEPTGRAPPVDHPDAASALKCANCGGRGHRWWDCTPLTRRPLAAHLQRELDNKGRSRGGNGEGGAGRGGGGAGRGGGGAGRGDGGAGRGRGTGGPGRGRGNQEAAAPAEEEQAERPRRNRRER